MVFSFSKKVYASALTLPLVREKGRNEVIAST
jgi:hypothetical protein